MGILRRVITTETVWCTLIFYVLSGSVTDAQTNVAFNKLATQSSTFIRGENPYGGGPSGPRIAEIAVDGDPLPAQCVNVNNYDGLWSHTLVEPNSWWMVDLGEKYYIYDVNVCNRGQIHKNRLNNTQLLFSIEDSNMPADPDPANTANWKVFDTIRVYSNTPDLIQIPEQPGEISVARHVAIFNAYATSVTLREVTVTGFTDEEKNAIVLNHGEKVTPFNISLTANITSFNSTVFAPSRLILYKHTDGNRIELEDMSISDGNEELQLVLSDLMPESNFSFVIELISNQFLLSTESFLLSTPEFICEDPSAVDRIDVIQTSDSPHPDRPVKLTVSWPVPQSTGCEPLPDQVLTFEVTIDGNLTIVERAMVDFYVEAYTNYSIIVRSINSQGKKSEETGTNLVTISTAPGDSPTGLSIAALNQTCVYVGWTGGPSRPNGPISKYEVSCNASGMEIITSAMPLNFPITIDICDSWIKAGVRVSCSVAAFTSNNQTYLEGPASAVESTVTHVDLDVDIEQAVVKPGAGGIFPVPIPVVTPPPGFELTGYRVVLSNQGNQARRKRQNSLCSYVIIQQRARPPTFDPLLSYNDAQACNLDYYLAAVLTEAPEPGYRFPVGDGLMYNGVYNTRLEEGSAYDVYYGVNVRVEGETDVVVQMLETPVASFEVFLNRPTTAGELQATEAQEGLSSGAVTGIAVSTALIASVIAVIVVAFLLKKKQLKQQELGSTKSSTLQLVWRRLGFSKSNDFTASQVQPEVTLMGNELYGGTAGSNSYGTPNRNRRARNLDNDYENLSIQVRTSEAIPVEKLKWYTESNSDLIYKQYTKLGELPFPDRKVAQLAQNRSKNRYKELYPGDDFRVTLKRLPSQGSDYINASYMPGYYDESKFIAAQGPTENNVVDFWLMIWQQNIKHIVMVTRLFEANKMKCLKYWPDKGENTIFGDVTISTTSEDKWPDFIIRTLHVIKGSEAKSITHYQFTGWPDHDVPHTTEPLLSFLRKVSDLKNPQRSSPILTHCSAGVGRTGAIIALDTLQDQAAAESKVDFYKCVAKMRERRPNMVQTKEQFMFIHKALIDALSTKEFKITASQVVKRSRNRTLLSEEFQYIESKLAEDIPVLDTAMMSENLSLNRKPNVLPDDKFRVILKSSIDGQSYINAVRVNSYRVADQFFATQIPMQETIKDFWQLVHENSVKVIVQFGDSADHVQFYPWTHEYVDETHTVSTTAVRQKGRILIYDVQHIKENRSGQQTAEELCIIKLPQLQHSSAIVSVTSVLAITEVVMEVVSLSDQSKILVCCNDGASPVGLFITAFNCIQSLQQSQEVEVYIQVLQARQRRRQFIESVEEYKALYDILSHCADQPTQYENVS